MTSEASAVFTQIKSSEITLEMLRKSAENADSFQEFLSVLKEIQAEALRMHNEDNKFHSHEYERILPRVIREHLLHESSTN